MTDAQFRIVMQYGVPMLCWMILSPVLILLLDAALLRSEIPGWAHLSPLQMVVAWIVGCCGCHYGLTPKKD